MTPAGELRDRALGALLGLAVGDALGMPTQYLSRETIRGRYGVLDRFEPGPPDNDISRGTPAGRVTDDTDQALILAENLIAGGGRLDQHRLAADLLAWERRMEASGSLDLLGPSTRRALALIEQGHSPEEGTGRWGDTDGAAMRVTPVGVATPAEPLSALVDAVHQSCFATHDTGIAIAGASAIAAAVSSGIDGRPLAESLALAVQAAQLGAGRGHYIAGADPATRIEWALELVSGVTGDDALETIYRLIGVGVATQEAVPAALAIVALYPDDPWQACRNGASLGGDCDTIAAMAGAVAGAHRGAAAFPTAVRMELERANPALALERTVDHLLALRASRVPPPGTGDG